ncbi:hypothetical protein [Spirosoma spitsbergense]|uniref:hypothetical protein n=1 Tax=Spirosoma spitsbergense TaxID=431554 RepID=UPI0003679C50|nr:hypothetical protein [Spirosoma spitsbergense]
MERTLRIAANISTIVSILVFVYPLTQHETLTFTFIQKLFIAISLVICAGYVIHEIISAPKKYKTELEINNYMKNWIKKPGRTVIFTRDMSWVNNREIENDLMNKSRNRELIICLPKHTLFTSVLVQEGAEIYTYEHLNFTPKSRFTFINYGSNSSKVAIGRKDDDHNHIITEFTTKDTIEYFLAEDLVNVLKSM